MRKHHALRLACNTVLPTVDLPNPNPNYLTCYLRTNTTVISLYHLRTTSIVIS